MYSQNLCISIECAKIKTNQMLVLHGLFFGKLCAPLYCTAVFYLYFHEPTFLFPYLSHLVQLVRLFIFGVIWFRRQTWSFVIGQINNILLFFLQAARNNVLLAVPAFLYAINNYLKFTMQVQFSHRLSQHLYVDLSGVYILMLKFPVCSGILGAVLLSLLR